jgi:hypothetical protein
MRKLFKLISIFPSFLLITLLISAKTYAICPVCTVAIGAGVGLSRWLGIDDTISGIWIGGLLVSTSLWTANWLRGKKINFKYMTPVILVLMYVLTFIPLHYSKMLTDPYNILWGINKIILGTSIGTILFFLSVFTDRILRKKNDGKVYVPYQKVILPVGYLLLSSLIMYFFFIRR